MEDIRRVFYHELGHYTANMVIKHLYGGYGVESFFIAPCTGNSYYFCGGVKPKVPPNMPNNPYPPKHRLVQSMLAVLYGCIFESYHTQNQLDTCFSTTLGHGIHDCTKWHSQIKYYSLLSKRSQLENLNIKFLHELRQKKLLGDFIPINHNKYLIATLNANTYEANLSLLDGDLERAIRKHKKYFRSLKNQYEQVINKSGSIFFKFKMFAVAFP